MGPTLNLRLVRREVFIHAIESGDNVGRVKVRDVLQQEFRNEVGYEWRDVPVVDEKTGEPVTN